MRNNAILLLMLIVCLMLVSCCEEAHTKEPTGDIAAATTESDPDGTQIREEDPDTSTPDETTAVTENVTDPPVTEFVRPTMDYTPQRFSTPGGMFTDFSSELTKYVGNDKVNAWIDSYAEYQKSPIPEVFEKSFEYINMYMFVHEFDIPREVFDEYYIKSYRYYGTAGGNGDLLYGGTMQEYLDYYDDPEPWEFAYRVFYEGAFKYQLVMLCLYNEDGSEKDELFADYMEWQKENLKRADYQYITPEINPRGNVRIWSIPEFIYRYDVPLETVLEALERGKYVDAGTHVVFDYDFDLIYDHRELVERWIATKTPMEVDELIRKDF